MAERYVYFYLSEDYETDDENTETDDTEQRPQRTSRIHTLGDIASLRSTHTPATDTTNSEETRALVQFAEHLSQMAEQLRRFNEHFLPSTHGVLEEERRPPLRSEVDQNFEAAKCSVNDVFDRNAEKVAVRVVELKEEGVVKEVRLQESSSKQH
ncbi:hypothetical protein LTR56_018105 [Elasticomyces elasticus]|nr:hypothetical protein LTR56_018105 [Elasticomyces elasticus]KAK3642518.1 hypothetical protein LTR22_016053 [Elasticomyces elasticus]